MKKHRKSKSNLKPGKKQNVTAATNAVPTLNSLTVEMSLHGRPLPPPPNREGPLPLDSSTGSNGRLDTDNSNDRQMISHDPQSWRDDAGLSRSQTVLRVNPAYNTRSGHTGAALGEDGGVHPICHSPSYDYPRMPQRETAAMPDGTSETDASGTYEN